jgi:dihydroorotase
VAVTLALTGGRVLTPGGVVSADVMVSGEVIEAISETGTYAVPPSASVVDIAGLTVMPGAIDTHTHLRDPGYTHKEDITTGTRAAAAGGYTTVCGMPNVDPPTNTLDRYLEVLDLYRSKSLVDFNHNPSPTSLAEVPRLARAGAIGFKVYMIEDTVRGYPHQPGVGVLDRGAMLEIAEAVATTGLPLMVHPHDQDLMRVIETRSWDRGARDHLAYARAFASYDGMVWDSAAAFLVRLQEATGVRMHVLHVKTPRMVRLVREAKASGLHVTAELNPVAVFLCNEWENIERLGPYALSTWTGPDSTDSLWEGLIDGTIDVIGTDHAPHTRSEKEIGWTDMWQAAGGVPQIQDALSLFLSEVNRGRITLERVAELTSSGPAVTFGLYPRKGAIIPGSDADLVMVNLDAQRVIRDEDVQSKCGWTPFTGRIVHGVPVHTVVRGTFVMRDGEIVGQPGIGRQVVPVAQRQVTVP